LLLSSKQFGRRPPFRPTARQSLAPVPRRKNN